MPSPCRGTPIRYRSRGSIARLHASMADTKTEIRTRRICGLPQTAAISPHVPPASRTQTRHTNVQENRLMSERYAIGVICKPAEESWVREFFELFKTSWEFYRYGETYSVVLATSAVTTGVQAKLVVMYSSEPAGSVPRCGGQAGRQYLRHKEGILPIYGNIATIEP